eukprot:4924552-Prymnesium_polylepis.1
MHVGSLNLSKSRGLRMFRVGVARSRGSCFCCGFMGVADRNNKESLTGAKSLGSAQASRHLR